MCVHTCINTASPTLPAGHHSSALHSPPVVLWVAETGCGHLAMDTAGGPVAVLVSQGKDLSFSATSSFPAPASLAEPVCAFQTLWNVCQHSRLRLFPLELLSGLLWTHTVQSRGVSGGGLGSS